MFKNGWEIGKSFGIDQSYKKLSKQIKYPWRSILRNFER